MPGTAKLALDVNAGRFQRVITHVRGDNGRKPSRRTETWECIVCDRTALVHEQRCGNVDFEASAR